MNGPLEGLLVVALEQAVAAPFATRQLADLGARVIKIERAGAGDFARGYDTSVLGQASYFVWLNRGKESVELDVKSDDGRAAMAALLARADVFVQNLAPGAAERLGLGADGLLARHPRLICCSVSGYGPDGPYAGKKAYDLLVQCEAGLLSVTGTPEAPCKAGISVADIAAGMYAYTGVLTALYERERTGRGSSFEVSLLDALGEWMTQPYYYTVYGQAEVRRTGARHASISPDCGATNVSKQFSVFSTRGTAATTPVPSGVPRRSGGCCPPGNRTTSNGCRSRRDCDREETTDEISAQAPIGLAAGRCSSGCRTNASGRCCASGCWPART